MRRKSPTLAEIKAKREAMLRQEVVHLRRTREQWLKELPLLAPYCGRAEAIRLDLPRIEQRIRAVQNERARML